MDKKTKKIKNRLTCFSGLSSRFTRHPSNQRFPQLSRPPRNHRHASRHYPRPPDRHRHPGEGSEPRRAVLTAADEYQFSMLIQNAKVIRSRLIIPYTNLVCF